MKHLSMVGSVAVIVSCAVASPGVWASSGLAQLASNNGQFLLRSSQGYLGVDLRDVDADRASALKLKDPRGAEIVTVDHDAPAGKAGLKPHDVVIQMNGQTIEGVEQLRRMLHETPAGRTVALVVSRDGQPVNVSVQLADRATVEQQAWLQHFSVPEPTGVPPQMMEGFVSPHTPGAGSAFLGPMIPNAFYVGASVNPVGAQLADYFGVKSGTGLLVESVDDDSPAAKAGLKAGDVILKVNSDGMASRGDWIRAMHDNRGKQVQLTVVRNKQEQTLTMTAGDPKKKGSISPLGSSMFDPSLFDGIDPEMIVADLGDIHPEQLTLDVQKIHPDELAAKIARQMKTVDPKQLSKQVQRSLRDAQKQLDRATEQLDLLPEMPNMD